MKYEYYVVYETPKQILGRIYRVWEKESHSGKNHFYRIVRAVMEDVGSDKFVITFIYPIGLVPEPDVLEGGE